MTTNRCRAAARRLATPIVGAAFGALLLGCAPTPPAPAATGAPVAPDWLASAREVADRLPPRLLGVLKPAIERDGAVGAITICRDEAPRLAQAASAESGWQVRRVSLRPRNPKAAPDEWERSVLEALDRQVAAGGGGPLERSALVVENGQPVRRYMKALPVQAMCLQCHGTADKLGPGVHARLAELYPADRATGYDLGQLRGAITLRQPVR